MKTLTYYKITGQKVNAGLPLVTYQGCKLKFYQRPIHRLRSKSKTDAGRMVDTPLTHANSHPQRLLLDKKSYKIPALTTKRRRKPYKSVFVKPPGQMQNKWYFQKDIAGTKLLMITASSCDLVNTYISPRALSNNITLWALNVSFFQNQGFQNPSATTGYIPKENTYLYSSNTRSYTPPTKMSEAIYLGNTKDYQPGKPITQNQPFSQWG